MANDGISYSKTGLVAKMKENGFVVRRGRDHV
jgi:hypothetical protein